MNAALSLLEADAVVLGAYIVDVNTATMRKGNLAIKAGRIALVGKVDDMIGKETRIVKADGLYAIPGPIDPHAHIESTLLTPAAFVSLALPRGTIGSVVDPHEIANVLGLKGVKILMKEAEALPFEFFFQAPSCVPSSPGLESGGARFGSCEVSEMFGWMGVTGLGEVMSFHELLKGERDTLKKIKATIEKGLIPDGHLGYLTGRMASAYPAVGIRTDHSARLAEEVIERLELGLYVMVQDRRDGVFDAIIQAILDEGLDTRHLLFCTDDITAMEIVKRGHLISLVRRSIALGLEPIKAIQAVTLNVAECYGIEGEFGSIAPSRYADLLLVEDLKELELRLTMVRGALVAEGRSLKIGLKEIPYPKYVLESVKVRKVGLSDLRIRAPMEKGRVKVRVATFEEPMVAELPVEGWRVLPEGEIAKIVVINRYGKRRMGKGFFHGSGLRRGAFASTVAHDSHNLIAMGFSDEEILKGIERVIEMGGGIAAVDGEAIVELKLPVAGLMNYDVDEVVRRQTDLEEMLQGMGLKIPLTKLTFSTLLVGRAVLTVSDKGLVDTRRKAIVSLFLS